MFGSSRINDRQGTLVGCNRRIFGRSGKSGFFGSRLPNANGAANRARERGAGGCAASCAACAADASEPSAHVACAAQGESPAKRASAEILIAARGR